MSQENGYIQILYISTVSSEPSVFAETEQIENPKSEVAANALFANHRQRDVLYILIGSCRDCENIVAYPIHV